MAVEVIAWNIQDYLKTVDGQVGYLQAALEDGDPVLIASALSDIAQARGMEKIAEEAGLSREPLTTIAPGRDPQFGTVLKVIKALGLRLAVASAEAA